MTLTLTKAGGALMPNARLAFAVDVGYLINIATIARWVRDHP